MQLLILQMKNEHQETVRNMPMQIGLRPKYHKGF